MLHVMHTAELHGRLDLLPRLASAVQQFRAQHPHSLLLDSGGWSAPVDEDATPERMRVTIEVMHHMGYHAAAVGLTDVARGLSQLLEVAGQAGFPLLSANLRDSQGRPLPGIQATAVATVGGLRVGMVGLSSPSCARVGQSTVLDPESALLEACYEFRMQHVNKILMLSNVGAATDRALLRAVPRLTAIVGGGPAADQSADSPRLFYTRSNSLGTLTINFSEPGGERGETHVGPNHEEPVEGLSPHGSGLAR
jgi:2',3'-cyclic-nucleotide 2'-phosphodiesterase (5'-nucleotidase family)